MEAYNGRHARQRITGQTRIVAALDARGTVDPDLGQSEAADIVYTLVSPDVHRILTVDRSWSADGYERSIARSLGTLVHSEQPRPARPKGQSPARARGKPVPAATKRTRA